MFHSVNLSNLSLIIVTGHDSRYCISGCTYCHEWLSLFVCEIYIQNTMAIHMEVYDINEFVGEELYQQAGWSRTQCVGGVTASQGLLAPRIHKHTNLHARCIVQRGHNSFRLSH